MTLFYAAFLGMIQGIAEFLPISSSGHLSIFQNFLGLRSAEETSLFFDVLLHFGTLISIIVYYRKDLWEMIKEFGLGVKALAGKGDSCQEPPPARRMILLVIVGTLPLFLVLPVKDLVDGLYHNTWFIGGALLATGGLLFLSDRLSKGKKTVKSATLGDTVLVGIAQAFAVLPGLSRAGSTIAAGLMLGYRRDFAVRFSFLLSIPAVLGANVLTFGDAVSAGIDPAMIPSYLIGVAMAAVSGYFAIHLVNLLSNKGKFGVFSYYCWGVGALTLILSAVL